MGTVMQKRIMEVYDANKHRDTLPFKKIGDKLLERLQAEQKEKADQQKKELRERAKERAGRN